MCPLLGVKSFACWFYPHALDLVLFQLYTKIKTSKKGTYQRTPTFHFNTLSKILQIHTKKETSTITVFTVYKGLTPRSRQAAGSWYRGSQSVPQRRHASSCGRVGCGSPSSPSAKTCTSLLNTGQLHVTVKCHPVEPLMKDHPKLQSSLSSPFLLTLPDLVSP